MAKWQKKPTSLEEFRKDFDYIMFVDENGHASHLKSIIKKINEGITVDQREAFFTVTGCVIKREDFPQIRSSIIQLKEKHWPPNGEAMINGSLKRVCFHSRDIRRRNEPFTSNQIDRENFLDDLSNFIDKSPFTIFSSTVNMELYAMKKYPEQRDPYNMCMDFIFERFGKFFLNRKNATGVVVLECRGKKEDYKLLRHCVEILNSGTFYASPQDLCSINGIYFNTKWAEKYNFKKSYFGLEIADLVSFPIHKFIRDNIRDPSFEIIERKLYGYKSNNPKSYIGKGLKVFPNY